jgi:hypothetical protein
LSKSALRARISLLLGGLITAWAFTAISVHTCCVRSGSGNSRLRRFMGPTLSLGAGREQGVKGMSAAHRWCWPIEQIGLASQNFSPPRRIELYRFTPVVYAQDLATRASDGSWAQPCPLGLAFPPAVGAGRLSKSALRARISLLLGGLITAWEVSYCRQA